MSSVVALSNQVSRIASDSDEEIDTSSSNEPSNSRPSSNQMKNKSATIVAGEASESDDDTVIEQKIPTKAVELRPKSRQRSTSSPVKSNSGPSSPFSRPFSSVLNPIGLRANYSPSNQEHSTILHRKLHEKNDQFKKELIAIACNPYHDATREIKSVTQQLMKSQQCINGVSSSLRRVSYDLAQLKEELESIRQARSKIPSVAVTGFSKSANSSRTDLTADANENHSVNVKVAGRGFATDDDACEADTSSLAESAVEAKELN